LSTILIILTATINYFVTITHFDYISQTHRGEAAKLKRRSRNNSDFSMN